MIIHGIHSVREALRADPSHLTAILVAPFRHNSRIQEIVDQARTVGVSLRFESPQALTRKVGNSKHQGVVAELAGAPYTGLEEVLTRNPRWLLLADNVEDPHNLGALIRTAEAAGLDALLFPQRRAVQATATVVKASSGAALHFPLVRIGNVASTVKQLKDEGFWSIGLDMEGKDSIDSLPMDQPLLMVVGGENRGLRPVIRKACDLVVGLPMPGRVASLNLSVAAGVLIYQILFRRLQEQPA